jgi:hypothetical protein
MPHAGPKHGQHFEIDQLWRGHCLPAQALPEMIAFVVVVGQRWRQHGRIDDDHRRSRSARRCCTAKDTDNRPPARAPARSSTSSKVGRLAVDDG